MIFNWNDGDIQRNIIYFKFDYNNENWLFTTLNEEIALINITKSLHKTYFLNFNEENESYEIDTTLFTCNISIKNKEINIKAKNNA